MWRHCLWRATIPQPAFSRQNDKCLFLNEEKNAVQCVSRAHYLIKAKRIFAAR
jgi:hypothetical protein